MSAKVLVTGGTGFTGSHLVRRLLERGQEVVMLDTKPGLLDQELTQQGAEIVYGSVTDSSVVDRLVQGCDTVCHLAAAFREVNLPKQRYWDINVEGTRNVLEAAYRHGVRKTVLCSTCGVHGNIDEPPATENAPIRPADYYQYTKYEGEKVAQEFAGRGLNITILRPAAIYGPGDPERWLMLVKLVARGRFLMLGDGQTCYHPLYIDNLTDAFELAMKDDAPSGEAYLIADDEYFSLEDLVLHIAQALGIEVTITHLPFWPVWAAASVCEAICMPLRVAPPLFRRRIDWFRQDRAFDISKAKKELGYRPLIDLPTGLARTIQWYVQEGYLGEVHS